MNDSFCILPWISLQLRQNGNAYPCCRMSYLHSFGSLKENTISEIWNSSEIKQVRQNMRAGKPTKFCSDCYKTESLSGQSLRTKSNTEFADKLHRVEDTDPDGHLNEHKIAFLDIRFSNICNLKCRSCDAENSTSWYNDKLSIYGATDVDKKIILNKTSKNLWPQLENLAPGLTKIYFAGGEPLLDEDHYKFLELLISIKKTDLLLSYNSNLTQLAFKNRNILDLWRNFNHVHIGASIDGIGTVAKYLRHGSNWENIKINLHSITNSLHNVSINIFPTVGVLNCFHIPELLTELIEMKFISKPADLEINILHKPDLLNASILNTSEKSQLRKLYTNYLLSLRAKVSTELYLHIETELFTYLTTVETTDLTHLRPQFRKYMFLLDQIRDEKTLYAAPELSNLLYEEVVAKDHL